MFVTPGDFNLIPYNIPNLQLVANTFPLYIDKREEESLLNLLGYTLYVEFIASLMALPPQWNAATTYAIGDLVIDGVSVWQAIAPSTGQAPYEGPEWTKVADDKWLKLKNGYLYTDGDQIYHWRGMKSLLVPYIFEHWLHDTFDNYSGIGVVESKAENSVVIEPKRRIVDAHNDYATLAGSPDGEDDCGCSCSGGYNFYPPNSLAGFIAASNAAVADTYPNWHFTDPGFLNTFGL